VVVNFWASWCTGCTYEAKRLSALAARWQPRGVRFVGIDAQDAQAATGEQHGGGRARDTRAHDDGVVHLEHSFDPSSCRGVITRCAFVHPLRAGQDR
jgi:thiol-disulfide isomerase/thioredoxin